MASFFDGPPKTIVAKSFSVVPQELWAKDKETEWQPGTGGRQPIFIEGPCTDTQGNLYIVDVPYGRIYKCNIASKKWDILAEWDGEPNGLAMREDGMIVVADYKNGMLLCDPSTGKISKLLPRRNLERFKGPNDVIVAKNGDIYFTDQGQSGMTQPDGCVYRVSPQGKLDCLINNGPSPNGLCLTPDEKVLYVAMTRENSVWRCPLHPDGTTTKVAKFFQTFGVAGPDGMKCDAEGNLFVSHASLGCVFVVDKHGLPVAKIVPPQGMSPGASVTNMVFGLTAEDKQRLYFVESKTGSVHYVDWHCEGCVPLRQSKAT